MPTEYADRCIAAKAKWAERAANRVQQNKPVTPTTTTTAPPPQQQTQSPFVSSSSPTTSSSSAPAPSTAPLSSLSPEQIALAEQLKTEGNTALTSKRFDDAISLYTQAIAINAHNHVYYSNRYILSLFAFVLSRLISSLGSAAAYQHKREYLKALTDSEKAVSLRPDYAKGYSRMGTAYDSLGRLEEAIDKGYRKAADLEPNNEEYESKYQDAIRRRNQLRQQQQQQQQQAQQPPQAPQMPNMGGLDFVECSYCVSQI